MADDEPVEPWNILVVDDDEDIQLVTKLALRHKAWRGRDFRIVAASSSKEAKETLRCSTEDFHVAVIDVVMETQTSGLDLCNFIRDNCPSSLRLILRTGQPGVAPEADVLRKYDIDAYLAKPEATEDRLYSTIRTCLRTHEDLVKLEAANVALTIANAELARREAFTQRLVAQIGDHDRGDIAELLTLLNSRHLDHTAPDELRRWIASIQNVGKRVADVFQPHDFEERVEEALQQKSMLVLLGNRRALRFTQGALAGTRGSAAIAESWEGALKRIRTGRVDLVFVDWNNVGVLNEAIRYNPDILAVLLTNQLVFERHGNTIMSLPIASAVVINELVEGEGRIDPLAVQELVVTAGKLISSDIFGPEKYLAWGVAIHEMTLRGTRDRNEALDKVENFAKDCQLRGTLRSKLITLTDELLMNAIWDAPVDGDGKPKYATLPRNQHFDLSPEEYVTLQYGSDGNTLAISVMDRFGRLERDVAVRYLVKCFGKGAEQIDVKEGGAGLGLYMAYLAMSSFVINVQPGLRTEVIGLIKLRGRGKVADAQRSFHYFRTT